MYNVQIALECAPAAKVGGLGDVVYGLSRELAILFFGDSGRTHRTASRNCAAVAYRSSKRAVAAGSPTGFWRMSGPFGGAASPALLHLPKVNGDIAKSIVVEDADLISQWGRQNSRTRHGECPGGFRGSYRQSAVCGDPSK
jgi:hypothetical protein